MFRLQVMGDCSIRAYSLSDMNKRGEYILKLRGVRVRVRWKKK
jgi:hypothetical protein